MKKIVLISVALLVAGCSTTPAELRAGGRHFETNTALAPDSAAQCLLKRIEAEWLWTRGRVLPTRDGVYELTVWQDEYTRLVADIAPEGGGAKISAWFSSLVLPDTSDGAKVLQRLLSGC